MKVFKFSGAGISNMDRIAQAGNILKKYSGQQILVVIPAMGKTAGSLEKVAEAFYNGHREEALALFETIKKNFLTLANYLLVKEYNDAYTRLLDIFTEVEWLLHDRPAKGFDYYYDQIVCSGGLLTSAIISAYFNESGIQNEWVDIRDIVRTDNHFRDASIDWSFTQERIDTAIVPMFNATDMVITQGSIGATAENESVTLGEQDSDYLAAVLANMLQASELTIWKDVKGIMNADPKEFPGTVVIPELNYEEAAEMAYYGAQAIHPKTIKPLQNKNIPLRVKCLLDQDLPGTVISDRQTPDLPPVIIIKRDQALVSLHARDSYFTGGEPMAALYQWLAEAGIRPNLLQAGSTRIQICVDDKDDRIEKLALAASGIFDVQVEKGLSLLAVRHYREELIVQLTAGKKIRLSQQTPKMIQMVLND